MKKQYATHLKANRIAGEIAESYDFDELENALFYKVAEKIGAQTSVLLQFRRRHDRYEFNRDVSRGVGQEVHKQYVERFYKDDPVLQNRFSRAIPNQKTDALTDVYRLSDVSDDHNFVRTEYYNEFLKPAGIRHVLALAIQPQSVYNDIMVIVGFHRPLGMRDFGENAIKSIVSIAPVIGSTIAKLTFKDHLQKYRILAESLCKMHRESGYIILDDMLQIQETSPCVGEGAYGDLSLLMHKISASCHDMKMHDRDFVQMNYLRQDNKRTLVNEKISIEINRVKSINSKGYYAVRISFVHTNIAIAKCSTDYEWTLRESEIVMALAQGLTNQQIAQSLLISVRTVENHLRAVYAKADVTNRTQLLRRLLVRTPAHRLNM